MRADAPILASGAGGGAEGREGRGSGQGRRQRSVPSSTLPPLLWTLLSLLPRYPMTVELIAEVPKYVCRAGTKLEAAFERWRELRAEGKVALDAGLWTDPTLHPPFSQSPQPRPFLSLPKSVIPRLPLQTYSSSLMPGVPHLPPRLTPQPSAPRPDT